MKHLIVICGPTGIGKTHVGITLAQKLNAEIISADSRQIFRELKIGTAVPSEEELATVPHHFVQSHSIHEPYNASTFEEEVIAFLREYYRTKDVALLVGGSGMYIDAVCKGIDELPTIPAELREKWQQKYVSEGIAYLQQKVCEIDPEYYDRVDKQNPKRLLKAIEVYEVTGRPYSKFLTQPKKQRQFLTIRVGLNTARDKLYKQINTRVDNMIEAGLVEEAKKVLPHKLETPLKTVGYRELFDHFEGKISLDEAITQIKNHTRAYARRQLTWFRRYEDIQWFEPHEIQSIFSYVKKSLHQ